MACMNNVGLRLKWYNKSESPLLNLQEVVISVFEILKLVCVPAWKNMEISVFICKVYIGML